ncbi:MAG: hypothetical protein CMM57_10685 [Rhodospirillaceae bacterium]|nr:hypothetical protein [Rhodospirillaceae bacterium]
MSARVWQVMIKKLTGKQRMLESRLIEQKRRCSELQSKIKSLESYIQDYLTHDSANTVFDRRQLLLRESTVAFTNQLNAAKLKLEESLNASNSECESLRNELCSLLVESSKYQKMQEAYTRRQHSMAEQAERKYHDELYARTFVRSNKSIV